MQSQPAILYCRCAYAKVVPQEVKDRVLEQLSQSEVAFDCVADLCELSAKKDSSLKHFAKQEGLKVVACYPRAVKWLFSAAGAPLAEEGVEVINMRTESADGVTAKLHPPTGPSSKRESL